MSEMFGEHVRPVSPWLRRVLIAGAILGSIAGTQLYVGSEETDRFFSWTIASPLTAAFLGAGYYSALAILLLSARERVWSHVRVAFFGLLAISVLILAATLVHIEQFHTDSSDTITLLGTWAFIGTYVVLPPVLLVGLAHQLRLPGGDPPRVARLEPWFRLALAAQAAVMLALGTALLIAPEATETLWPWPLTPLTGRAIGAFLFSVGLVAALAVREDDWTRLRGPVKAYAVLAALQLGALARYGDEPSWRAPSAWIYLGFVVTVLALGLYGSWATARSTASTRPGRAAVMP